MGKEIGDKINAFANDIPMQIEREYFLAYGVIPAIGISLEDKDKRSKKGRIAVYQLGKKHGAEELISAGYRKPAPADGELVERIALIKDKIVGMIYHPKPGSTYNELSDEIINQLLPLMQDAVKQERERIGNFIFGYLPTGQVDALDFVKFIKPIVEKLQNGQSLKEAK